MNGYIGVGGTARKIKGLYVGVNGVARTVQKAYVGDASGKARLWYQRGKPLSNYAVGSSVYFKVNNVRTQWLVVQQGNPDASIYDSSCDGTWLLMKNIYENRAWNSSNVNSYGQSSLHTYLNSTFLGLLETGVQSAVKQVKIPYRPGSGSSQTSATGANGLSAKVFLLSATEVSFHFEKYMPIGEGAELAYFKGCADNDDDAKRVAYLKGSAKYWWLRSPMCNGTRHALPVDGTGDWSSFCLSTSSYGVRPCLILPRSATVDDSSNVIGG